MARETEKKTTTTQTLETKRVTSLESREGQRLSSLEEAVVRMHHGVSVKPEAQLATNGVNDEVMAQLLEMEVKAFEQTDRLDELDDIPEDRRPLNDATERVVSKLKSKM